ncbi:Acyltransferase [Plasmodiophora brassicae]
MGSSGKQGSWGSTAAMALVLLIPGLCVLITTTAIALVIQFDNRAGLVLVVLVLTHSTYPTIFSWHTSGGCRSARVRRATIFKAMASYFHQGITVVGAENIPDSTAFILGMSPHGILPFAGFLCFATDAVLRTTANVRVGTLTLNFRIPIFSQLLGLLGVVDVSRASIMNVLNRGAGNGICVFVGGACEAAHAGSGEYNLIIRRGFINVAIQSGAAIVPCVTVGEHESWKQRQYATPAIARLQRLVKACTGVFVPVLQSALPDPGVSLRLVIGQAINTTDATATADVLYDRYCRSVLDLIKEHDPQAKVTINGEPAAACPCSGTPEPAGKPSTRAITARPFTFARRRSPARCCACFKANPRKMKRLNGASKRASAPGNPCLVSPHWPRPAWRY